MAYKVIILYRLYMPSYVLGTFTEYPYLFITHIKYIFFAVSVDEMNVRPTICQLVIWRIYPFFFIDMILTVVSSARICRK